ncbi:MAG: hypothetical protein K2X27_01960 [Candidatus Obscuribacterales bacterium]|nr:hypothetical protein [Candidatus Obscuribacterales bacterium]
MFFSGEQDKWLVLALSAALLSTGTAYADDPSAANSSGTSAAAQSGSSGSSSSNETAAGSPAASPEQSKNSPGESTETAVSPTHNETPPKEAVHEKVNKEPELHKSSSELPKETAKAAPPAHPAAQPIKLYGRIEQLSSGVGAKLPLKMVAMTPIRDSSLDSKLKSSASIEAGKAVVQSYPVDYRGSWSGTMNLWSANFDKSYFEFDRAEAEKEMRWMRPGNKGQVTVNFYQTANNRVAAQPCEVFFTAMDSAADQMKIMQGTPMGAMFGGANNSMLANMQVPVTYSLHLGAPIGANTIGITGNQISNTLMKNELKELTKGVLEQEVVTRDTDRNPSTGKTQTGYSESVLRFTKISNNQLYLQAAFVYYRNDGHWQTKYILYGTLDRSYGNSSPSPAQNPYGAANPFGSLMQGGANPYGGGGNNGAGNLQQQMQLMQKMMKQLQGQ